MKGIYGIIKKLNKFKKEGFKMQTNEELLVKIEALKAQYEKEISQLKEENQKLQKINNWYKEQLDLGRAKKYGTSSEKSEHQEINMFNEAEAERGIFNVEPTEATITPTPKKKKNKRGASLKNLPVVTIEYKLSDEEIKCKKCNEILRIMKTEERTEIRIIPEKVQVIKHITYYYTCRNCAKTEILSTIVKANSPKALVAKSLVSPSVMAYLMTQKFANSMPLYRLEQSFKRLGVTISRQNLSNWMIMGAKLLQPLLRELKEALLRQEILHADETPLEVLCEPDRPAAMKSYMWLYRTSGNTSQNVVMYDYQGGRSGKFATEYLEGFRGYLHCDGYAGYHALENQGVTLCGCWAHARRKFYDAGGNIKTKVEDKFIDACENKFAVDISIDLSQQLPQVGFDYCNKLFELQRVKKLISAEQPVEMASYLNKIQKQYKDVTEEFYYWVDQNIDRSLPKSLVGGALTYAKNQKKYLTAFLRDDRIELSNNRAERSIKPFVIGRKNWLFCNTPSGAKASATIYSIVQTAIENDLKPIAYLDYVFTHIQKHGDDKIEAILPWSINIPQTCKIKENSNN